LFKFLCGDKRKLEETNWFKCPVCGKKLLKITEASIVKNEIYCRCCKTSIDVDIKGLEVNKATVKKSA
jgi:transcription elongation factor Elf1